MALRITVHPAHLRVALALASLMGEGVQVGSSRIVPLGDVWFIAEDPTQELPMIEEDRHELVGRRHE
jgi:hypothetical protein